MCAEGGFCVLDPCAGSGTIPLEAAEALGLVSHGLDKSLAVVKGAQANAAAAGLTAKCTFRQGNARSLDRLYPPHSFDAIVTNAPWGVQTAKSKGDGEPLLEKIYRGLLYSGHRVCKPGAALVILVLRWPLVIDLARRSGLWRVVEVLPIRTSNLTPVAVKLERIDVDEPKVQAQMRLAQLTGYFDFGGAAAAGSASVEHAGGGKAQGAAAAAAAAPEEEEAAEEEAVAVEAQGAVHAEDESVDGDNGACSTTTTTLT